MVSIKKIALAVIAVGVSGLANAAMYTPAPAPAPECRADNVTVPCEKTAWDVGIQALYVQTNSIEDVTQQITFSSGDSGSNSVTTSQDFRPEWLWGFRLEGSYHWGTGTDLNLNWTHFSNNDSTTTDFNSTFFSGDFVVDPVVDDSDENWDFVTTAVDQKFDAVNLEFGQRINMGEHVSARLHAGLQYARIEQDITQTGGFLTSVSDGDLSDVATSDSKFSGIGPRLGFDLMYDCGNGFAIVGNTAASLLVGNTDLNVSSALTSVEDSTTTTVTATGSSTEREIVPGLEAKLGLQYTHPCPQGDFILQGGYQVTNYWNSVHHGFTDPEFGGVFHEDENFAFQGVYFGVKWIGNA